MSGHANSENRPPAPPENFLQMVSELATDLISVCAPDGTYLYASPSHASILGFTPQELIGRSAYAFIYDEDLPAVQRGHQRLIAGDQEVRMTVRARHRNGSTLFLEGRGRGVCSTDGKLQRILLISRDVTESMGAEQALRDSERRYRMFVENLGEVLTESDQPGTILYVSPNVREVFGYAPEELIGRSGLEHFHPDDAARLIAYGREQHPARTTSTLQFRYRHKSGRWLWCESTTRVYQTEKGDIRSLSITRDITQRRLAAQQLQERERRFRFLLENTTDVICELTRDLCILFVSTNVFELTGFSADELLGTSVADLAHPDDLETLTGSCPEVNGLPSIFRYRSRHRDGTWRWLEVHARALSRSVGEHRFVCVTQDVTQQCLAEQALRDSEQRFLQLAEVADRVFWFASLSPPRVEFIGPAFERIWGAPPESVGNDLERWTDLIHPDDRFETRQRYLHFLQGSDVTMTHRNRIQRPDGEVRWIEDHLVVYRDGQGHPQRISGLVKDITHEVELEQRLSRAQRQESLSILAGGVAHDFNNLLQAILGHTELAEDETDREKMLWHLKQIELTSRRAAELTNQMLAYSGRSQFVLEPIHLPTIAEELLQLARVSLSKRAAVELEVHPGVGVISGDPAQLRQVVLNLLTNASDALAGQPGTIWVKLRPVCLPAEDVRSWYYGETCPGGTLVELTVRDTGCGIEKSDLSRVFDPFFSTKSQGRGLGLAAVAGIVRSHQGAIQVNSRKGHGAEFRVVFPVSDVARSDIPDMSSVVPLVHLPPQQGHVLIVDDEAVIRDVVTVILERSGYRVTSVECGAAALELYDRSERFDIIVLDWTMPEMNGSEVVRELQSRRSTIPVILVSGYAEQEARQQFEGLGLAGFLQKPFRSNDLLELIQRALDPLQSP